MSETSSQTPPATLTVAEAAQLLGLSRDGLYGLIRRNAFPPAIHAGRRVLVSRARLERWLDGQEASP